ncbi:hypothetical protein B0H11DRAFT_2270096 [Mycena galericulata]|nr:hypothetical protein B0H11DRAFT_2270096 [Mycena galericulata]
MVDDKDIYNLCVKAHISRDCQNLWDFDELGDTIPEGPERLSTDVVVYLRHMKDYWRAKAGLEVPEEWTHLILPPPPDPDNRVKIERWFPLSLISTIFSPISPQLQLVPAGEFTNRCMLADYAGPSFPLRYPPEESDSRAIAAMVDLLLCESDPSAAFSCLASLLRGTHSFQLKMFASPPSFCIRLLILYIYMYRRHPGLRFPHAFGAECYSIDFALVPEWQPTTESMIRRSRKAPVTFSSPALTIGIQLQETSENICTLASEDLQYLARATQPHLEALLVARHQRYPDSLLDISSLPPPCIFVIAFRHMTVFLVAHIAYFHQSIYRYQSVVVDQLPFPPYVPGDQEGVMARLRLIIALLTIRGHTDRLASLWDDLNWGQTILDAELAVVQDFTGIVTPSPSEYEDPEAAMWGDMLYDIKLAPNGQEVATDINPPPSEIAYSKERVDAWLLGIVNTEEVPEAAAHEF